MEELPEIDNSNNYILDLDNKSNKEQIQVEKSSHPEDTSETKSVANQNLFSCRLCRLKCSNEKALYEHVSRFCFILIYNEFSIFVIWAPHIAQNSGCISNIYSL